MSSKREKALSHITAIVAITGQATSDCLRVYVENRISHKSFQKAVEKGRLNCYMFKHNICECPDNNKCQYSEI